MTPCHYAWSSGWSPFHMIGVGFGNSRSPADELYCRNSLTTKRRDSRRAA